MKLTTFKNYFIFKNDVGIVYRKDRLCIISTDNFKVHEMKGNIAQSFIKLTNPITLEELCENSLTDKINIISEFIRLGQNGLITEYSEKDNNKEFITPFWEDAYFYHLTSKTTENSKFHNLEEQATIFKTNLDSYESSPKRQFKETINLPIIHPSSKRDLIDVLINRRTYRTFEKSTITLDEVSFILFHTWGYQNSYFQKYKNYKSYFRTSPSCGGLQSINAYALILGSTEIKKGLYKYDSELNELNLITNEVEETWLSQASAGQKWVDKAALVVFMTANFRLAMERYNVSRLYKMLYAEAGHFSQTFLLNAEYIGKSGFLFGAQNDELIETKLNIDPKEEILLFAVGLSNKEI